MRPSRHTLLGCASLLAFGLTGCGEAEKAPDAKALAITIPAASKGGLSDLVRSSQVSTAAYSGEAQKSLSSIESGQTLRGVLESGDPQIDGGQYVDSWVFKVEETSDVALSVSSDEFDTVLHLAQGSPPDVSAILGTNDDADGTNSALQTSLKPGSYTLVASSYGAGVTGNYEVSLGVAGGSSASGGPGALRPGRSVSGRLSESDEALGDGTYYQDWSITGTAGERVTVSISSADFDTYLLIVRDGENLAQDDDGAGGTDSRLTFTLPSTGTYSVRANTYVEGATGEYTLTFESSEASAGLADFSTGGSPNGRYALLIGIDDYPGTGSDLRGPVEDARIMERVLVNQYGFDPANILTLNDSRATRANIAQGVVQHLGQAGPDGVAVLFYSGHGTQIGENIGLTGSLDPEPRGEGDEAIYIYGPDYQSSVILDEELGYLIESIDAGRKFVVVDACHSGEITRASGDAPQSKRIDVNDPEVAASLTLPSSFITSELKALELTDMSLGFGDFDRIADVFRNPTTHIMWGSSTEEQVSWTSNLGNGASVFTYFVGERMMNMPGSTTIGQLHQAVHDDVVSYIRSDGNMTMQEPQMMGPNQNTTLSDFFRQR